MDCMMHKSLIFITTTNFVQMADYYNPFGVLVDNCKDHMILSKVAMHVTTYFHYDIKILKAHF